MTAEVKDQIAECFEEMSKAHEAIKKVYKSAAKLVPKLSAKGMGVFLEALALGTPDILDTRVANILQDARLSRKLHEEVKTTENVSLFDKHKEIKRTGCYQIGCTPSSSRRQNTGQWGKLLQLSRSSCDMQLVKRQKM